MIWKDLEMVYTIQMKIWTKCQPIWTLLVKVSRTSFLALWPEAGISKIIVATQWVKIFFILFFIFLFLDDVWTLYRKIRLFKPYLVWFCNWNNLGCFQIWLTQPNTLRFQIDLEVTQWVEKKMGDGFEHQTKIQKKQKEKETFHLSGFSWQVQERKKKMPLGCVPSGWSGQDSWSKQNGLPCTLRSLMVYRRFIHHSKQCTWISFCSDSQIKF